MQFARRLLRRRFTPPRNDENAIRHSDSLMEQTHCVFTFKECILTHPKLHRYCQCMDGGKELG
jgi:hypothetical protein